ncbi:MAG: HD domain-containing protein [Treponema sp.]|jgi:tRNA nucleotidyltransferase/poly(A) polymerase|nr:HD domain-containing protein [Treponema sp.]
MLFIPRILKDIALIFAESGKQSFLVGGAVRDMLRGEKAHDFDLATDATPEEVAAMFCALGRSVIPTGIKHGTVTVRFKGESFEITTFRTESEYRDGRHPEKVAYAGTIEEDLSRRDFTMNAIAMELPKGRVVDPFNGRADIQNGVIRCVGSPLERFGEDGLRSLRCVRFASQLGFSIDKETLAAIPQTLSITAKVAAERKRDELDKIIGSRKPSTGFLLMEQTGLLHELLPELAMCRNVGQKGGHRFDVLDHSLLACDFAAENGWPHEVRLAALFHDIGKPVVCAMNEFGVRTFYRHEREGAALAKNILSRFRYSNTVIDTVVHLIKEHMFQYDEEWSDAAVRRFIIRVGEAYLPNLYKLRHADAFATAGEPPSPDFLTPLMDRASRVLDEKKALSRKDLAISGKDLIALDIKHGPRIGVILHELLEAVLEDPELNAKEKLLEIAGKMEDRARQTPTPPANPQKT